MRAFLREMREISLNMIKCLKSYLKHTQNQYIAVPQNKGIFMKLNYQKFNFNEYGKWLHVVGPIPINFLKFWVEEVSLVSSSHHDASSQIFRQYTACGLRVAQQLLQSSCLQAALAALTPKFGSFPRTLRVVLGVPFLNVWILCTT